MLTVLAASTVAAGCGSGSDAADCLADPGPSAAKYATTPAAARETARAICARAEALNVSGVRARALGAGQVAIAVAEPGDAAQLIRPSRVRFYDWEANLWGNPAVSSGTALSVAPFNGLYPAVRFAARQRARAEPEDVPPREPSSRLRARLGSDAAVKRFYDAANDSTGDRYYLFGAGSGARREVLPPGRSVGRPSPVEWFTSREAIAAEYGSRGAPRGSTVIRVPRGVTVARAPDETQPRRGSSAPSIYYVLEDDAELTGDDLQDPRPDRDPTDRAPTVSFLFTRDGGRAFQSVTRRVAQRGLLQGARQNFAVLLDDQVQTVASIDPAKYPDGIEPSNGAQIYGVGTETDAKALAKVLGLGPLPAVLEPLP